MPKLDDPTIKVDMPRPAFRQANPGAFGRAQGDPDATRRLGVIEQRASSIKDRFREHFDRNEELWVVREAMALTAKRTFPTLQHPRPSYAHHSDFAELMMTQARRNVHARALQRMSNINATKTRLQNAVIRNGPRPAEARMPSNDQRQKTTLKQGNP